MSDKNESENNGSASTVVTPNPTSKKIEKKSLSQVFAKLIEGNFNYTDYASVDMSSKEVLQLIDTVSERFDKMITRDLCIQMHNDQVNVIENHMNDIQRNDPSKFDKLSQQAIVDNGACSKMSMDVMVKIVELLRKNRGALVKLMTDKSIAEKVSKKEMPTAEDMERCGFVF